MNDSITDVPGVRVGQAEDMAAKTGVTVILVPSEGLVAGLHVGGNAPSTRQADALGPRHIVDRIHGICLCGGSGFGLDAGGGVMLFLEKQGVGLRVQAQRIPTVPTAAIFDLGFGDASVRPNRAMGLQACQNAHPGPVTAGSVGAGTGATVGKLFGPEQSMKGGVGSASTEAGGLIVGALVVANPYGDITDHTGRILAGARRAPQSLELADSARMLAEGRALSRGLGPENTTLAVIAVNAALSKPVASGVAAQATLGLSHVIRPFHSHIDGDLTIVLSAGERLVDPNQVGLMAADTLRRAVGKAIRAADGFGIVPAHRDVCA